MIKEHEFSNCVVWTRFSTPHQETNHQRNICETYATAHELSIKGYYGGTFASKDAHNDSIKQMLEAIKNDASIKYLLVSNLDRLSRDCNKINEIISILKAFEVTLVICKPAYREFINS